MRNRKINILDIYFDKVGMVLWPRFTNIFEHFLDNVKDANPRYFKPQNTTHIGVYYTTYRYVSLMLMLYKIAYKTGQNMLLSRLTRFQALIVKFIEKLSIESFNQGVTEKERMFFRLNNIQYIIEKISELHIEHGIGDLEKLELTFEQELHMYVSTTMKELFPSVSEFVLTYFSENDDPSLEEEKEHEESKMSDVSGIDTLRLENTSNEFRKIRGSS